MASADDRLNIHAQLEHLQVRTRGRSRQLDQTAAAIGSTFFFFQIAALSFSTCLLRSFARPECRRGIEQSEAYCSSVKKSKAREDMPQTRRTRDEFEPEQEKKTHKTQPPLSSFLPLSTATPPTQLNQSKHVGTGHADTSRFEWAVNMHRDTAAAFAGHAHLTNYLAVATNEHPARVRAGLLAGMLLPCGLPPAPPGQEEDEYGDEEEAAAAAAKKKAAKKRKK